MITTLSSTSSTNPPMGRFSLNVMQNTPVPPAPVVTNLTIVHFNDNHKALSAMPNLVTAVKQLSSKAEAQGQTVLRFNGGDNTLGDDESAKNLNINLINQMNVDVNVPGNHNFDAGLKSFAMGCEASNAPWLVANLAVPAGSSLEAAQRNKQFLSVPYIIQRNGDTFGVIGATLTNFDQTSVVDSADFEAASTANLTKTASIIQHQVHDLEAEGVNKIILVSHMGYDKNQALIDPQQAYKVTGIDVIVGGHTHQKLTGIQAGKTLFFDSHANPVVILEAGQNAETVGETTLGFDTKGKVVQLNAVNLYNTKQFLPDANALQAVMYYYQPSPEAENPTAVLATLAQDCFQQDPEDPENPIGNLIADTLKAKTGVDIAIIPSSQLKDGLPAGEITPITLKEIAPFNEPLVVVSRTGRQILQAFEQMAKLYPKSGAVYHTSSNVKIGLNISGGKGELKSFTLSNQLIDYNKTYSVAVPQFFVQFPKIQSFHTSNFKPIEPVCTLADCLEAGIKEKYGNKATFCFEPDGRLTVSHGVNKYATKAIVTLPFSFEGYTDDLELEPEYASFSFRPETAWFRSGSTIANRSVSVSSGKPSVTLGYA
ncbi:MAG: bifunctional metallophosphatase/5'-nucleotidase [Vampirovibrio sp.]|nr:bifunctional metallophosphatase/5'-nucleotidase [Vampirovibrio sp.]